MINKELAKNIIIKKCPKCGKTYEDTDAMFCMIDKTELESLKKYYADTHVESGLWTLICEEEFYDEVKAKEAINSSCYYGDQKKAFDKCSITPILWEISCSVTTNFDNEEAVKDAAKLARHWDDGDGGATFSRSYKYAEITEKNFPLICNDCEEIVSNDTSHYCVKCNTRNWRLRYPLNF